MDTLWAMDEETGEEGEVGTYEDALGRTKTERLAPLPPPMMGEGKGASSASSRKLDSHTGALAWATKGGDVPNQDPFFDDDRIRPVDQFAATTRARSSVHIGRNRDGTQPEAAHERLSVPRSDLYRGYNVDPSSTRVPKVFPDTRRGLTPLHVVGAERAASVPALPLPLSREAAPLASDAADATSSRTRGIRTSGGDARSSAAVPAHMSADVGMRSLAPRRAADNLPDEPTLRAAVVPSLRSLWRAVDPSSRVTQLSVPSRRAREGKESTLGDGTDVRARAAVPTRTGEEGRAAERGAPAREARSDARPVSAPPANPRTSFSDAAAVAAEVVLGTADSRAARPTAREHAAETEALPLASRVPASRRFAPLDAASQARGDRVEAHAPRVAAEHRARDGRAPSLVGARFGTNLLSDLRAALLHGARSRDLASDARDVFSRAEGTGAVRGEALPLSADHWARPLRADDPLAPRPRTTPSSLSWVRAVRAVDVRSRADPSHALPTSARHPTTDVANVAPAPPPPTSRPERDDLHSNVLHPLPTGATVLGGPLTTRGEHWNDRHASHELEITPPRAVRETRLRA